MSKQHRVSELNDRIKRKKFGVVLARISKHDSITRIKCSKPKYKLLKLQIVKKKTEYEYTKVIFTREVVKFSYNEWIQIQEIIDKHKDMHDQEVKLTIQQLFKKVKKLNLLPSVAPSRSSTIEITCTP